MTKAEYIEEFARRDNFTLDKDYNEGLKAIRKYGYDYCKGFCDVVYYVCCNPMCSLVR